MLRIIPFFLIVTTSLLFFVEFENEFFFKYFQLSPALCGPELIDQSILPIKFKSLNIFKKKNASFFRDPSLYSSFFKWSEHCYLFVEFDILKKKISLAIPRPSLSGIHRPIIFTKKIQVSGYFQKMPSLNRDIHHGDS